MLNGLKHHMSVRRMERVRRRTIAAYGKDRAAAKAAGKKADELENIRQSEHHELTFIDEEIGIEETRHLVKKAKRYRLPVPREEGDWEESIHFGTRYLTNAGQTKLRTAIRAEQKAVWGYWKVQLVSSVIGLVGGLMGAVAYFKPPLPPHP